MLTGIQFLLSRKCTCSLINLFSGINILIMKVGNEIGESDPVFMRKHGDELKKDSGKWIDSCVWHGKAHTWEKIPWVIKEV